jgi:hypothetical protein
MIKPELFDTVELLVDLPEQNLRAGTQGAIVHQYTDEAYEVEFTNEDGETIALCALQLDQFIVVWRAETQQWVPIADRVAQIVARLPDNAGVEVLDFARFLSVRVEQPRLTEVQHAAAV